MNEVKKETHFELKLVVTSQHKYHLLLAGSSNFHCHISGIKKNHTLIKKC